MRTGRRPEALSDGLTSPKEWPRRSSCPAWPAVTYRGRETLRFKDTASAARAARRPASAYVSRRPARPARANQWCRLTLLTLPCWDVRLARSTLPATWVGSRHEFFFRRMQIAAWILRRDTGAAYPQPLALWATHLSLVNLEKCLRIYDSTGKGGAGSFGPGVAGWDDFHVGLASGQGFARDGVHRDPKRYSRHGGGRFTWSCACVHGGRSTARRGEGPVAAGIALFAPGPWFGSGQLDIGFARAQSDIAVVDSGRIRAGHSSHTRYRFRSRRATTARADRARCAAFPSDEKLKRHEQGFVKRCDTAGRKHQRTRYSRELDAWGSEQSSMGGEQAGPAPRLATSTARVHDPGAV